MTRRLAYSHPTQINGHQHQSHFRILGESDHWGRTSDQTLQGPGASEWNNYFSKTRHEPSIPVASEARFDSRPRPMKKCERSIELSAPRRIHNQRLSA